MKSKIFSNNNLLYLLTQRQKHPVRIKKNIMHGIEKFKHFIESG
jgi:hypothetical protein